MRSAGPRASGNSTSLSTSLHGWSTRSAVAGSALLRAGLDDIAVDVGEKRGEHRHPVSRRETGEERACDPPAAVVLEGRGLLPVGNVFGDSSPLPPRRSAEGDEAGARGDAMNP